MVDLVEDEVEVRWDGREVSLYEVNEDVDGVGVHPSAFIATGMEDGGTDVAGEGVRLRGRRFGRVVVWGDGLGVKLADNVDVGVINRSDGRGSGGSGNGGAELV